MLLFRTPAAGEAGGPLAGVQAQWAGAMRRLTAEVAREAWQACLPPPLLKRRCCGAAGPCPLCCREPDSVEAPQQQQAGKRQRVAAA